MSWLPNSPGTNGLPSSQESDDYEPPSKQPCHWIDGRNMNGNNSKVDNMDWESWDSCTLAEKLHQWHLGEFADTFIGQNIDGSVLKCLDDNSFSKMGIRKVGDQLRLKKFIEEVTRQVVQRKVFNDPIHGHIELHPLCVEVIDTPQFQRMRFLKQLGCCYFVYPGATHNRFEHSLGVCYLAGQLVRALQRRQPNLNISDLDVLCVEIAGLCHDLGHGPFSHLFDGKFIPYLRPGCKWKHEDASRDMLDFLIKENNLKPELEKWGLNDKDIEFIKEQVSGPLQEKHSHVPEWPYQGRSKDKAFLYEIVANKRNGIDVDKWDYFARDCHMLGIKNNFDHKRFIQFARVLEVDRELQICSRDKEVGNLYDMFHTRSTLHRRAYQHKVTNIVETMITEAMIKANDHVTFPDRNNQPRKMSEAIDDMYVYSQLTDHVFFLILYSTKPELKEARMILQNVLSRKLYKCVGQTQLKSDQVVEGSEIDQLKKDLFACIDEDELECSGLKTEDVAVHLVYLDYGMKDKNPIDNVRFYMKDKPDQPIRVRKDQVSQMLPETFLEQCIRIHYKKQDLRTINMLKTAFQKLCEKKKFPTPKEGNALELTPVQQKSSPYSNMSGNSTPGSAGKFKSRLSF